jgi:hypothetical protein
MLANGGGSGLGRSRQAGALERDPRRNGILRTVLA